MTICEVDDRVIRELAELRELMILDDTPVEMRWLRYAGTALEPQRPSPRQATFLDSPELEVCYGGAAGGGKSTALLMGALQYVHVPGYAALIIRRTLKDLVRPGAILDRAHAWWDRFTVKGGYTGPDPLHWDEDKKTWTFPCPGGGRASITFGYLDNEKDKLNYQGAEIQYLAIDELTQMPDRWYLYLISRLRRLQGSSVPIRARSGTNPGGIGHEWVYERFVNEETRAEDCAFVPALLEDNPHLDQVAYRKSLSKLDDTTRNQLEKGIWVRDAGGLVYPFDAAMDVIPKAPHGLSHYILGQDYGYNDDCSFVVLASRPNDPNTYIVEAYKMENAIPSVAAEETRRLEQLYHFVSLVGDLGGLGKGYAEEARRRFQLPIEPADKNNKRGYQLLMADEMKRHRIKVVGPTCQDLLKEWRKLPWDEKHEKECEGFSNHCADGALYGWRKQTAFYNREAPPPKTTAQRLQDEEKEIIRKLEESVKNEDEDPFNLL